MPHCGCDGEMGWIEVLVFEVGNRQSHCVDGVLIFSIRFFYSIPEAIQATNHIYSSAKKSLLKCNTDRHSEHVFLMSHHIKHYHGLYPRDHVYIEYTC